MSKKKKGKPAVKQAPKKKTAPKKTARKSVSKSRSGARLAGGATGRTLTVTIFLFRTGNGNKIRTSPQRVYANPGDHVSWNVVNLVDGSDVPVTITWPGEGPWGKDPIVIHSSERKLMGGASYGRFKYVVSALDAQEDPEVECPEN